MSEKGAWIEGKARSLLGMIPGSWEDVGNAVLEGRCPGEHLHSGSSAKTDARVHLCYGAAGQPPGVYCLHNSCKGVLDDLNDSFRSAIFAKDENYQPTGKRAEEGVVQRAPWKREDWVEDFSIKKLRGVVKGVPIWSEREFMERSPIDVRGIGPAEFLEYVFAPGERALVFTDFKSQGDFLWEVGRGGYRLGDKRGVTAVRSKLPTDGGKDGIWYLSNPVDGQWYANSRREGKYSRRSMESVTAWRHMVLECDEEKTFRKRAGLLRDAMSGAIPSEDLLRLGGKKWGQQMLAAKREKWEEIATQLDKESTEIPGLWMKLLAMAPLAIKAIYTSGGASMHALVAVDMKSKAEFDDFLRMSAKRTLPIVGADPGAMTPVRLTRLPGCTRGGRVQKLIYLNPAPATKGIPMPIRDLKQLRKVNA